MRITVELPDDIARGPIPVARLEALAVEGYHFGKLTHHPAARLLGLTRFEFDDFLKDRQTYAHAHSFGDLERDSADLDKLRAKCLLG